MSPSLTFHELLAKARKLVPFLPPPPISPRRAKEQDASPLYSQLPPELRQMIWEICFCGHTVHISQSRKKLCAKGCIELDVNGAPARGFHNDCSRINQPSTPSDYISLLLTCKRMYISRLIYSPPTTNHLTSYFECISTLYRETLFDFSHSPRAITNMSQRLPAIHIAHISRVNLYWISYYPLMLHSKKPRKDAILWVDVWDALAAMEGLKWLRFELTLFQTTPVEEWEGLEWTLLVGVRKVTRPSHFELILPFPAAALVGEEPLPCTIIHSNEE